MAVAKAIVALHGASVTASFSFARSKGVKEPIKLLGLRGLRGLRRLSGKCGTKPRVRGCS